MTKQGCAGHSPGFFFWIQSVQERIRQQSAIMPDTLQKSVSDGMSALINIENHIKNQSSNINHPGIGLDIMLQDYFRYLVGRGSLGTTAWAMVQAIKTVIDTQTLTEGEIRQLKELVVEIVGDAGLANTYVDGKSLLAQETMDELDSERSEGDNNLDSIDASILKKYKKSMTADDFRMLRELAKKLEATPENAVKIGSEKTWREYLKYNPSTDIRKSAKEYIDLIINTNPWPVGYTPEMITLPVGSTFYMVMSNGQLDTTPGGWATFDKITSINDARSKLAITEEFKDEIDRVNTYETNKELPVQVGPVGPQIDLIADVYLPGGATQIKLVIPPSQKSKYIRKTGEYKIY